MTCTCAGCGKHVDAAMCGTFAEPVMLGYACGCLAAFTKSGRGYKQVAAWARERRAGKAS